MKTYKTFKLFSDSHDIVMRFNHAPTEGFESDVGSKTSIRIVNSQASGICCERHASNVSSISLAQFSSLLESLLRILLVAASWQ